MIILYSGIIITISYIFWYLQMSKNQKMLINHHLMKRWRKIAYSHNWGVETGDLKAFLFGKWNERFITIITNSKSAGQPVVLVLDFFFFPDQFVIT